MSTATSRPPSFPWLKAPTAVTRSRVTLRAVLVGLISVLILCGITPYNDNKVGSTFIAGNHFPIGALIVIILMILVGNTLLRWLRPRSAFTPAEIVTVWCMIVVASGIPSSGLMRYLVPHIIAGHYYASPENRWDELVFPHVPQALEIRDATVVREFFEGLPPGAPVPWTLWIRPMCTWGVFTLGLYLSFIALSVLIRKQWVQNEHFTFPLVQIPVEMVEPPPPGALLNPLYRHPYLWIAIGIVTFIHTLNGLHLFFAVVPQIQMSYPVLWLTNKPWNYANPVRVAIYPLVIGFSYMLASEVCLSLWLFWFLYKVQCVLMGYWGLPMDNMKAGYGQFAFASHEAAGACIALALWFLYIARGHMKAVLRKTFRGDPDVDDSDEALSYRWAVITFVLGMTVMFVWLVRFGVQPVFAAWLLGVGTASFLVLTWMVAQAGLLFLQPTYAPSEIMVNLFGSSAWTPRTLIVSSLTEHIFMMDLREFLLPSLLNSQKITDDVDLHRRSLLGALVLAIIASLAVSSWAAIRLPFLDGAITLVANKWTYVTAPQIPYKWVASLVQMPTPPSSTNTWHLILGALGMYAVLFLRTRWTWFTLHPVGFIIASGYPMSCFWFSFFLGWLFKVIVTRYGGLKGYRDIRPFFIGLVIGDCLNGAIWIIVGLITRVGYPILPL